MAKKNMIVFVGKQPTHLTVSSDVHTLLIETLVQHIGLTYKDTGKRKQDEIQA